MAFSSGIYEQTAKRDIMADIIMKKRGLKTLELNSLYRFKPSKLRYSSGANW